MLNRNDVFGPAAHDPWPARRLPLDLPAVERFAGLEHALEYALSALGQLRHDLAHGAPQVRLERDAVDRGQALVQAEIAQLTIEQGEARGGRPIQRIQLREIVVRVVCPRLRRLGGTQPAATVQ